MQLAAFWLNIFFEIYFFLILTLQLTWRKFAVGKNEFFFLSFFLFCPRLKLRLVTHLVTFGRHVTTQLDIVKSRAVLTSSREFGSNQLTLFRCQFTGNWPDFYQIVKTFPHKMSSLIPVDIFKNYKLQSPRTRDLKFPTAWGLRFNKNQSCSRRSILQKNNSSNWRVK